MNTDGYRKPHPTKSPVINRKKIIFLTSWYWEGAFVLNELIKNKPPDLELVLLIQGSWWTPKSVFGYSIKYWSKFLADKIFSVYGRRYNALPFLSLQNKIKTYYINNINKSSDLVDELNPDYILVVGSRIIKGKLLTKYKNRILNFHTGILPYYRGPYSEFWAFYNNDIGSIGTTLHLLDSGIDTGGIVSQAKIKVNASDTPETAHIKNVREGSSLVVSTIDKIVSSGLSARKQDNAKASYYSRPSDEQMMLVVKKLNKKFNINFIE